jgi:hypothetical protein
MSKATQKLDAHPLVLYGKSRGWNYERTAKFFRISYAVYRVLVRGFSSMSFDRADACEKRSKGEVRAIDILRWQKRNRRDGY